MAFVHEVPVYVVDRFRKEHRRVLSFGRGRRVRPEQKNLVHAYVNGIGPERVDQLVHQLKNDFRNCWIQRVPFAAIDSRIAEKCSGRQVERRVLGQQRERLARPGLVAERLKFRDQADAKFPASRSKLARALACNRTASSAQLRMPLKRESLINLETPITASTP